MNPTLPTLLSLTLLCAPLAPPARAADAPTGHMTTVFLVLLKKGPQWTATSTPETTKLQERHLANIVALWKDKKLIVAGPLAEDGEIRGIFVVEAGSLDEARKIVGTDPAIQAGRLVPEIHPWWVDRRALPEAGMYCAPVPPS